MCSLRHVSKCKRCKRDNVIGGNCTNATSWRTSLKVTDIKTNPFTFNSQYRLHKAASRSPCQSKMLIKIISDTFCFRYWPLMLTNKGVTPAWHWAWFTVQFFYYFLTIHSIFIITVQCKIVLIKLLFAVSNRTQVRKIWRWKALNSYQVYNIWNSILNSVSDESDGV